MKTGVAVLTFARRRSENLLPETAKALLLLSISSNSSSASLSLFVFPSPVTSCSPSKALSSTDIGAVLTASSTVFPNMDTCATAAAGPAQRAFSAASASSTSTIAVTVLPMSSVNACIFTIIALTGSDQWMSSPPRAGGVLSLTPLSTSGLMRRKVPMVETLAKTFDFTLNRLKSSSSTETVMTHSAASPTTHAKLAVSASATGSPSLLLPFREGSVHRGERVLRTTAV
mmetsp:Transcript_4352/g.10662  ORF Transcript_4352/g.10662 Transcript_4352/m.10662 type:complete len:229 (-) Transcript_4352:549-1235(-)